MPRLQGQVHVAQVYSLRSGPGAQFFSAPDVGEDGFPVALTGQVSPLALQDKLSASQSGDFRISTHLGIFDPLPRIKTGTKLYVTVRATGLPYEDGWFRVLGGNTFPGPRGPHHQELILVQGT